MIDLTGLPTQWTVAELLDFDFPDTEEEIYELYDPRNGTLRYVGRSSDPWRRWYEHLHNPQPGRMSRWIRELRDCNETPVLSVVYRCWTRDASMIEINHIRECLQNGHDLYNTIVCSRLHSSACVRDGCPHMGDTHDGGGEGECTSSRKLI